MHQISSVFLICLSVYSSLYAATATLADCVWNAEILTAPSQDPLGAEVTRLAQLRGDRAAERQLDQVLDRDIRRIIGVLSQTRMPGLNLHDPGTKDDLIQEVKIKVFENWRKYDPSRKFMPWLASLTHNHALDMARKGRARRRDRQVSLDDTHNGERPFSSLLADGTDTPDVVLMKRDLRHDMRKALKKLSARDRELLELVYFYGLKYNEVSQRLHIPIGTVKSGLHDAKRRLRDHLGEGTDLLSISP